jgi:hypothetical protein
VIQVPVENPANRMVPTLVYLAAPQSASSWFLKSCGYTVGRSHPNCMLANHLLIVWLLALLAADSFSSMVNDAPRQEMPANLSVPSDVYL